MPRYSRYQSGKYVIFFNLTTRCSGACMVGMAAWVEMERNQLDQLRKQTKWTRKTRDHVVRDPLIRAGIPTVVMRWHDTSSISS